MCLLGSFAEVRARIASSGRGVCAKVVEIACKDVRGLNLARSLIADWDTIGTVMRNLPALRDLNLESVSHLGLTFAITYGNMSPQPQPIYASAGRGQLCLKSEGAEA